MLRIHLCWTLSVLLASLAGLANAQIYTWTDENGNRIFSDQLHPEAQKVDLPPTNTVDIVEPQPVETSRNSRDQEEEQLTQGYRTLDIVSPDHDEAVRANDGNVTLVVNATPPLAPGHILRVMVDGEMQQAAVPGNGQPVLRLTLNELDRGAHQIVALVTNNRGEIIQRSDGIRVYVQRTSLLQPARTGANAAPQAPQMPQAPTPGGAAP